LSSEPQARKREARERIAERDLRRVGRWIRLGFLRRARKVCSDAGARHGSDPRFGMYELLLDARLGAIPHEAALQRPASMGMPPTKTTSKGDRSPRPPSSSRLGRQSLSPCMPTRVTQSRRAWVGLQPILVGVHKFGLAIVSRYHDRVEPRTPSRKGYEGLRGHRPGGGELLPRRGEHGWGQADHQSAAGSRRFDSSDVMQAPEQ
jgi:hypothetical protein